MDSIINIVVGDHDVTRLMNLVQDLQQNPMIRVIGIAQTAEDIIERASSMAADAVLMEHAMIDYTAIDVSEKLKDDSPGTFVFTISSSISAEFVFKSKRAGIIEVFPRDGFVAREAGDVIQSYVYEKRKEWDELSQKHGTVEKGTGPMKQKIVKEYITKAINQSIILTYNTKGGVGKSTVATNLALAIKMSPYLSGQRVALIDFDCGGANVSTVCHIPDSKAMNRNLAFWAGDIDNLTAQDVDDLMISGPHGLMILPAPLNLVLAEKVSFELCDRILNVLKRFFSIIVIDGAPNISAPIDAALRHATHVLLIANAEGQSVKQLARTTKLLEPDPEFPEKPDATYILNKMFVVLNHAQGYSKYDLKPDEVSRTVGRPLLAQIPYSETVRRALHGSNHKQAIELEPDGEFSLAIKKLANDLVGAYPEGVASSTNKTKSIKPKRKKLFGFLKV